MLNPLLDMHAVRARECPDDPTSEENVQRVETLGNYVMKTTRHEGTRWCDLPRDWCYGFALHEYWGHTLRHCPKCRPAALQESKREAANRYRIRKKACSKLIRKELGIGNPRCKCCRRRFTPARSDARYCSPACKQRAYRKRHNGKARTAGRITSGQNLYRIAPVAGFSAVSA